MHRIIFVLILSLLIAANCSKDHHKARKDIQGKESINLDSASRATTSEFYSWYIGEYINQKYSVCQKKAPFKKFPNGKYGLDIGKYKECLDTFPFFSTSFKEDLIEKNRQCSAAMQNDTQNINPFEEMITLEKDDELCQFLYADNWVGIHGYNIPKIKIISASIVDSLHAEIKVAILTGDSIFAHALVSTVVENNEAKIDNIQLMF